MLDKKNNYIMEDYQKKSIFYSFLPGISGERGIPLWCHYLNRGQCIASFGVTDKDHAIMEFYPAHQAAERTPLLGFRTFIKTGQDCLEAFTEYNIPKKMLIGMNHLELQETLEKAGLSIHVRYTGLPGEPLAALMRKVTITNIGEEEKHLTLADGMAELIPYGVTGESMKEMGQTSKAWMQVKNHETGVPLFNIRASMEDSAKVTSVKGVHFAFAKESNALLPVIVDKEVMFASDSALRYPHGFAAMDKTAVSAQPQTTCNDVPCCFFLADKTLKPGESLVLEELYGMAESRELLEAFLQRTAAPQWFDKKQSQAEALTEEITSRIATKTGNHMFDAYCRQTFLDNLLRGGYPTEIGKHVFYLYSRKHGDMERDYNFFSMLPEYYSQGNGNFRDVNQNRRCDVQFSPFVKDENLKKFYNALQINGYNPLGIEKVTFTMRPEADTLLENLPEGERWRNREYTPGELFQYLETAYPEEEPYQEQLFLALLNASRTNDTTKFIEGYWTDHWTYNLDLLESYLSIYPDNEEFLLFEDTSYLFRQAQEQILPRRKRYTQTGDGIRQYHFLKQSIDTEKPENRYLKDKTGQVVKVNLAEKLFALATVKMAALDPYGMGIEMEGGKPGWYDALNGLPGLLGSSMAEAYELERMLEYIIRHLKKYDCSLSVLKEIAALSGEIVRAGEKWKNELECQDQVIGFWNQINDAKEFFWESTAYQVDGSTINWTMTQILDTLNMYHFILKCGIEKSARLHPAVPATYYYYQVTNYEKTDDGILPTGFALRQTPDFLEGAVHSLKLSKSPEQKREIYRQVRESRLFDKELQMYKVNASLSEASFELGRACAFTPGWLENESVWLHMEYKYLLELLKSGLYQEFIRDFCHCAVPFLEEETYGRSPLENSSFLASSKNPNEKIWGKGFVARLSGSTAEFLQMWQLMMFGETPFAEKEGELSLEFSPLFPAAIIGEEREIQCVFLGRIPVSYLLPDGDDIIPGNYRITNYSLEQKDGERKDMKQLRGDTARQIRDGIIEKITVTIER